MIGDKRTKRVKRKMSKARKTRVRRTKKSRVNRRTKRTKRTRRTRRTRRMRGGMEGTAGGAPGGAPGGRPSRKGGKIPEDLKSYLVAVDGEDSFDIQEKITILTNVLSTDKFEGKKLNLSGASKKVITKAIQKLEKAKKDIEKRETEALGEQMTQDWTAESMMESPPSSFGSDISLSSIPSVSEMNI